MIIEKTKYQTFHDNGQLWIDGEIGLVADAWIDIYNYRTGFPGYEGKPVARLGIWTKYYDNGQLAWQFDYGDGTYNNQKNSKNNNLPSFQKDGTPIIDN